MSFTFLKENNSANQTKTNTKLENGEKTSADTPHKIRVIHTSDVSFDDMNTLVRMLLFANNQNIIGLTPSAGPWQQYITNEYENILKKIKLYEKVYPNLIKHDPDYPTPDYLRSVTKRGNLIYDDFSNDTDGSMMIANALLDETDDSPIWVTCWGGPVTVTAALRYINDNFPEKKAYVAAKLKIYFIAAKYQDTPKRKLTSYIINHYNPAPEMIDNEMYAYTNGWGEVKYWCNNVNYSTSLWTNKNYNRNHGALANSFVWKNSYNDDVDGDAPSMLHILGSALGLRSTEDPTFGGWGSRFVATTDAYKCHQIDVKADKWRSKYKLPSGHADAYVQNLCYLGARWADDFQNELAVRADWCVKEYADANHPPVVNIATPLDIKMAPGQILKLRCNPSDPDGDSINCSWWQYKEAGTSSANINIKQANTASATFVCPNDTGKTIHVILEAQDDNTEHPLTRYARVVVKIVSSQTDSDIPSTPKNLKTGATGSLFLNLNWDSNTEQNLAGYYVKRSTTPGGPFTDVFRGITSNAFTDTTALPETTYYYTVAAVDSFGNESVNTPEVSATTLNFPEVKSFYDFEEETETGVADNGPAQNDGTLKGNGITKIQEGGIVSNPKEGQTCVEITDDTNGGKSYIEIPYADFHNASNYTFSAWIKWKSDKKEGQLFWQNGSDTEKTRHVDLSLNTGNSTIFSELNDTAGNTVSIQPENQSGTELDVFNGEWHQVSISLQNDTIVKLWTDGTLIKEIISAQPIALTADTNKLCIGCIPNNPDNNSNFTGFIDRVRIYDVALTEAEIEYEFNSEKPAEIPPVIPQGLKLISVSSGKAEVDWDDNPEPDITYNVYQSDKLNETFQPVADKLTISNYDYTDLSPNTKYYFVIKAVSSTGFKSEFSDTISATTAEMILPNSFYDFENETGTAVTDLGPAQNNAVLKGDDMVWATKGVVSEDTDKQGCVEISGTDLWSGKSYVSVPYAEFHNGDDYTFSVWIKWNAYTTNWGYVLWQNGDDYTNEPHTRHVNLWLYPDPNYAIATVLHNTDSSEVMIKPVADISEINIFDKKWHLVAITLEDGKTIKLWEDGILLGETVSAVPIAKTAEGTELRIGARPGVNMLGFIDRVRIYNKALGGGEMKHLFESEHAADKPSAVNEIEKTKAFLLKQNSPNPFSSETVFEYQLRVTGKVQIQIIALDGNVIATIFEGKKQPGTYKAKWENSGNIKGICFYRLNFYTDNGVFSKTKKMVITD